MLDAFEALHAGRHDILLWEQEPVVSPVTKLNGVYVVSSKDVLDVVH